MKFNARGMVARVSVLEKEKGPASLRLSLTSSLGADRSSAWFSQLFNSNLLDGSP
jgi:hypothetical protein